MILFIYINKASQVIVVLYNLDIGQFAFASATAASNCSLLIVGMVAFKVR